MGNGGGERMSWVTPRGKNSRACWYSSAERGWRRLYDSEMLVTGCFLPRAAGAPERDEGNVSHGQQAGTGAHDRRNQVSHDGGGGLVTLHAAADLKVDGGLAVDGDDVAGVLGAHSHLKVQLDYLAVAHDAYRGLLHAGHASLVHQVGPRLKAARRQHRLRCLLYLVELPAHGLGDHEQGLSQPHVPHGAVGHAEPELGRGEGGSRLRLQLPSTRGGID